MSGAYECRYKKLVYALRSTWGFYFIDAYAVIFGLICVWTKQILFVLSSMKCEHFLFFLNSIKEEGQGVLSVYGYFELLHTFYFLWFNNIYFKSKDRWFAVRLFFFCLFQLGWILFFYSILGNPYLHQWCSKGKNSKVKFSLYVWDFKAGNVGSQGKERRWWFTVCSASRWEQSQKICLYPPHAFFFFPKGATVSSRTALCKAGQFKTVLGFLKILFLLQRRIFFVTVN